jgi:DNA primase
MTTPSAGRVNRDDLLRRVDLATLLDRLALPAARTSVRRWRCLHPDHEDVHPSVSMRVVDGIGRWRCWSCGRGGTAIDALIAAQGLSVGQAIEHLARRALPEPVAYRPADSDPAPLHRSVGRYVDACHRVLFTRTGRPVLEWLTKDRRLSDEVLRANLVGADPGPALLHRRRGLPMGGLAGVLPVFNPAGGLVYVQARYLSPGTKRKYGNPVGRLGSNPGIGWIRTPEVDRADLLVVCEGILDGLTVATAGLHAVAVLGATYPSVRIAQIIADHAAGRRILIGFDGDAAGRIAAKRLGQLLTPQGHDAEVLDVPGGADLNSLAQAGLDWADRLLRSEVPA